jgi:hypothetical protein
MNRRSPLGPGVLALFALGVSSMHGCEGASSDALTAPAVGGGAGGQAAGASGGGPGSGGGASALAGGGAASGTGIGGKSGANGGKSGAGSGGKGGKGGTGSAGSQAAAAGAAGATMGCTGEPRPSSIPEDWLEYSEWACTCPVFVPGNSPTRPPPLVWGPCDFQVPDGVQCRRVVGPGKGATGLYSRMSLRPSDGRPLLQTTVVAPEINDGARHSIVTEIDGDVLVDFLQVNPPAGCRLVEQALSGDHYLFDVPRDTWLKPPFGSTSVEEGFIAGTIDQPLPTRTMKYKQDPDLSANWAISSDWIVQLRGKRTAFPWEGEGSELVYTAALDPNGLPGHDTTVIGKNIFIDASTLHRVATSVWTPEGGQKRLLGWPDDPSRSAGNLGTDGKDMVWTYTQGGEGDNGWADIAVMAAPFTTDAPTLAKTQKKLRKGIVAYTPWLWTVGCGHAARWESTSEYNNALVVVRVSDGRGWVLPGGEPGGSNHFSFGSVLGVTCDEIFTQVSTPQGYTTIARLRLDSLGPGLAPE